MAARTQLLVIAGLILLTPMVYASPGNQGNFGAGQSIKAERPDTDRPAPQRFDRDHRGKRDEAAAKILNLTEDQKQKLNDIRTKQKEGMKASFEQMKSNREALDQEIIKPSPDMNKINEMQNQLKTIQSQIVDAKLNSRLEIKKVLNHEQFAGFMALERERKFRMHDMHGKRHFRMHGFGHGFKGEKDHSPELVK